MKSIAANLTSTQEHTATALEIQFPIAEISQLGEQESWRKEINRPLYHIHKWWATRLGSVFRALTLGVLAPARTDIWKGFYQYHQFSGKIVLDPFMGSGTTLGEAIKLGAKAIGCDINPISTFMVRQAFTYVPEADLRSAFDCLTRKVATEIQRYYQTRDPQTGELIKVLYFFWVKIITTPEGEIVPLFSRYVFSRDAYPKKKPKAQIVCPSCWGLIEDRYDSTYIKCQHCTHAFNPQQGPASGQYITTKDGRRYRIKDLLPENGQPPEHRLYAMLALRRTGEKVYLAVREEDLTLFAEAKARLQRESLTLPTLAVRAGHNTDQARGYNYRYWRDFFNDRQLLCLGLLLRAILEIDDVAIQEQMLCLFSSTLEFNNLFCTFKGEGTGAVRHMFSHHILKPERTPIENSVWGTTKSSGTFCTLFESRLIRAKRYLDEPFEVDFEFDSAGKRIGSRKTIASCPIRVQQVNSWNEYIHANDRLLVLNGDSSRLPIPDATVDAVVTDPPYFDFIHYSELSDFFFAWLSPVLRLRYPWFARPNSSDPNEVQHKDPHVFSKHLASVFSECRRVLKDDGVLVFTFHHSRAEGWAAIYEAISEAGLAVVAAHPVRAELLAASPKTGTKDPISLDAVLVCKKRAIAEVANSDQHTAVNKAMAVVSELRAAGMPISTSDHFVVVASQMLAVLASSEANFDSACEAIMNAYQDFQQRIEVPALS